MNLSYEQFNIVFYVGLILAVIFFIVSVVLLFVLKIPSAIGELSGITEKRAIARIRQGKEVVPKKKNPEKHTDKKRVEEHIHNKKSLDVATTGDMKINPITAELNSVVTDNGETGVLETTNTSAQIKNIGETSVLEETDTSMQMKNNSIALEETGTVINDVAYAEQTTVLDETNTAEHRIYTKGNTVFFIREEIVLFVSDEIIV